MISFGIDELIHQNPTWKTKQLGLVTSNAATTNTGILSRTALLQAGFNIVLLVCKQCVCQLIKSTNM
jgi:hypothetical protein